LTYREKKNKSGNSILNTGRAFQTNAINKLGKKERKEINGNDPITGKGLTEVPEGKDQKKNLNPSHCKN